jgi:hypothetical protein
MADLIIRGMEMPKTCEDCPCHHYHSMGEYVCEATPMLYPWNLANTKGARKEWCPLVPVPPHGRLIDGDEFYDDVNESILLTDGFKYTFNLWFDEQQTIIPASKEETE